MQQYSNNSSQVYIRRGVQVRFPRFEIAENYRVRPNSSNTRGYLAGALPELFSRKRGGHKNGQNEQNCAVDCGIQGNTSNKNIPIYKKNLFGIKSIFESIQRFPGYRTEPSF